MLSRFIVKLGEMKFFKYSNSIINLYLLQYFLNYLIYSITQYFMDLQSIKFLKNFKNSIIINIVNFTFYMLENSLNKLFNYDNWSIYKLSVNNKFLNLD